MKTHTNGGPRRHSQRVFIRPWYGNRESETIFFRKRQPFHKRGCLTYIRVAFLAGGHKGFGLGQQSKAAVTVLEVYVVL